MTALLLETSHAEIGLIPVADAFAGTKSTDVLNLQDHDGIIFTIVEGAGGTGTYTVTVEACDDTTPSNTTAIPFSYRVTTAGSAPGDLTAVAATGYHSVAGANKVIEVEVKAADLLPTGYTYIRLTTVEDDDDPILGGVLARLLRARFSGTPATATT